MRETALQSLLVLTFFLFFFLPRPKVMAYEMFGIENEGSTANIFGGEPKNIRNWPKGVVGAIEGMQAKILSQSQAREKKNWLLDRQVTGTVEYSTKESTKETGFLGNLWESLKSGLAKIASTVSGLFGLNKERINFTGEDILYGPQDCKYPADRPGPVWIYKSNLDIQGTIVEKEKSVYYQFVASISMSFWDCEGVDTAEPPDANPVVIGWERVLAKNVNTLGPLVDEAFKQGLAVKYGITYKSGEEARKEIDEILKRQKETDKNKLQKQVPLQSDKKIKEQTCVLTDILDDHYDLITKNKGKIGSSDLKSALITKHNNELDIIIETNGTIPQLDANSSQAYEVGFDLGKGSSNPLTPRNGADILFVVDVGQNAVTGFKEIPGKQENWSPKNFKKLENGVGFTISLPDITGNINDVPPLGIYSSSAIGKAVEFDMMSNEGMKKCF